MSNRSAQKLNTKLIVTAIVLCGLVVLLGVFTIGRFGKSTVTAELVLSVERPDGMPEEEFQNYSHSQRKIIISEFLMRRAVDDAVIARTRFVAEQKDPVAAMAESISSRVSDDCTKIYVQFRCDDPEEATTILNEIVDEYFSDVVVEARVQRETLLRPVKRTCAKIERQVAWMNALISDAESALAAGTTDLVQWRATLQAERDGLAETTNGKPERLSHLDESIAELTKRITGADAASDGVGVVLADTKQRIQPFRSRLAELSADIADWEKYGTPRVRVAQHAKLVAEATEP
ncbi:MAG: hypothetical protein KDB27_28905 [Planctomycetales bacterium]|nr:hypothetical protein [Planctomycetales bacterium]